MRCDNGSPNFLVYSRAPCLGADQKTRGLWERDCLTLLLNAHDAKIVRSRDEQCNRWSLMRGSRLPQWVNFFSSLEYFNCRDSPCVYADATFFFFFFMFTNVFVDTRLCKTNPPRKRFLNFRQSCVLSTDRIEIHRSQPLL